MDPRRGIAQIIAGGAALAAAYEIREGFFEDDLVLFAEARILFCKSYCVCNPSFISPNLALTDVYSSAIFAILPIFLIAIESSCIPAFNDIKFPLQERKGSGGAFSPILSNSASNSAISTFADISSCLISERALDPEDADA